MLGVIVPVAYLRRFFSADRLGAILPITAVQYRPASDVDCWDVSFDVPPAFVHEPLKPSAFESLARIDVSL